MALLGIAACEPQPPVDPTQTLLLSVDKPIIIADGVDTATFTVTDHNKNEVNATILFADTKEAIEGNTFKTKYAGEYVFYAKYGNEISNPIGVRQPRQVRHLHLSQSQPRRSWCSTLIRQQSTLTAFRWQHSQLQLMMLR